MFDADGSNRKTLSDSIWGVCFQSVTSDFLPFFLWHILYVRACAYACTCVRPYACAYACDNLLKSVSNAKTIQRKLAKGIETRNSPCLRYLLGKLLQHYIQAYNLLTINDLQRKLVCCLCIFI